MPVSPVKTKREFRLTQQGETGYPIKRKGYPTPVFEKIATGIRQNAALRKNPLRRGPPKQAGPSGSFGFF